MIHVLVKLEVADFSALEQFESAAVSIMKNHGGDIVSAFEAERDSENSGVEIHLLQFPSKMKFEQYRADERLKPLAELREQAIRNSEITISNRMKSYG